MLKYRINTQDATPAPQTKCKMLRHAHAHAHGTRTRTRTRRGVGLLAAQRGGLCGPGGHVHTAAHSLPHLQRLLRRPVWHLARVHTLIHAYIRAYIHTNAAAGARCAASCLGCFLLLARLPFFSLGCCDCSRVCLLLARSIGFAPRSLHRLCTSLAP